ncbi:uncharacterized protein DEA37_0007112 [Paragonimus westermani]|uniref:Uncharacterized protein n=1 Tax=Paragonimus westermani TaxID=34504 RepID=A0A5J4NB44_9TREM|nr:uncharacterized protein DEA37_0007112 [Paragonimus westermani]
MVDLTPPEVPVRKTISNFVFIIPAVIVIALLFFFVHKIKAKLNEPRSSKMKKAKPMKPH